MHIDPCPFSYVTLSNYNTLTLGLVTANQFRCTVNITVSCCSGYVIVTWFKDNIIIGSDPAFIKNGTFQSLSTSTDVYQSTLSINDTVNITYTGQYKCSATSINYSRGYSYGPIESDSVNLTVQRK